MGSRLNRLCAMFTILLLCFFAGCSSLQVNTEPPDAQESSILSSGKVSAVNVSLDTPNLHQDQIELLEKNQVPDLIKNSMITSLKEGNYFDDSGLYTVDILITNFLLTSSYRTFTQVLFNVSVKDAVGKEIESFVTDSRSIRGGRPESRMTRILSQASQRALNRLCERRGAKSSQ